MTEAHSFPWAELAKLAFATFLVLGFIWLVCLVVSLVTKARDALRDRYVGGGANLHWIDILGVPTWVVIELACFVAAIAFALLTVWAAYSLAKDFRNWWHERDG